MIGNDIVDLDDPETAAEVLHPRFDQRVFTHGEREWIESAVDSKRARWTLWAAKEAAWKALAQRFPERGFSPRGLEVEPGPGGRATVTAAEARLFVRFDSSPAACFFGGSAGRASSGGAPPASTANSIHAIASFEEMLAVSHIRQLAVAAEHAADLPSRAVRVLACTQRALEIGVAVGRLTVARGRGGAPQFRLDDAVLPGALSFSHHGRLVAAVWTQTPCAEAA